MRCHFYGGLSAISSALLLATTLSASAATVDFTKPDTFNAPGAYGNERYCSCDIVFCRGVDGYNYQTSYFEDAPGISLDDEGLENSAVYRADDRRFSVASVQVIWASGDDVWVTSDTPPPDRSQYSSYDEYEMAYFAWAKGSLWEGLYYGIYGIRNGKTVAAYLFDKIASGTLALGSAFKGLDAIKFSIILPLDQILLSGYGDIIDQPGQLWCEGEYCTGFAIESMEASVVPLPSTLTLLAASLGGLGFVGRRKKKGIVTATRRTW